MMLGTMIVDEKVYPIVSIYLADGKIVFKASWKVTKKTKAQQVEDYVIFAPDGSLVVSGKCPAEIPRVRPGDVVELDMTMTPDDHRADADG